MTSISRLRFAPVALRSLHRGLAGGLAAFIALHLFNHLMILVGAPEHILVQSALRKIYRAPIVEPVLLLACAAQVLIGAKLAYTRRWPPRFWPRAQLVSGVSIAFFMTVHIGAALTTRASLDTNAYWAAAVVSRPGFAAFFAPYYVLGVAAVFTHLAAVVALRKRQTWRAYGIMGFGFGLGVTIVAGLMGAFGAVDLPIAYETYLDSYGPK